MDKDKLGWGRLEQTIRSVEDSKYDLRKIEEEKEGLMVDYEIGLRDKLSKIIDDIYIIEDKIFGIDEKTIDGFYAGEHSREYCIKLYHRDSRIELSLAICPNLRVELSMKPKKISLYSLRYSKFLNWKSKGREWMKKVPIIESKTSIEFAEGFIQYIENNFNEMGNEDKKEELSTIPEALAKIPGVVSLKYEEKKKKEVVENRGLVRLQERLKSLDVRGF